MKDKKKLCLTTTNLVSDKDYFEIEDSQYTRNEIIDKIDLIITDKDLDWFYKNKSKTTKIYFLVNHENYKCINYNY